MYYHCSRSVGRSSFVPLPHFPSFPVPPFPPPCSPSLSLCLSVSLSLLLPILSPFSFCHFPLLFVGICISSSTMSPSPLSPSLPHAPRQAGTPTPPLVPRRRERTTYPSGLTVTGQDSVQVSKIRNLNSRTPAHPLSLSPLSSPYSSITPHKALWRRKQELTPAPQNTVYEAL